MSRFIKSEVLEKTNLTKINYKDVKNQVNTKYVKVGFATESVLRKMKNATELQKMQFKEQCRKSMVAFVSKIMERSPLKYPVVKYISCLDPALAVRSGAEKQLSSLLLVFVENRIILGGKGDKIEREFKQLLENPSIIEMMKRFDRSTETLDRFWMRIFDSVGNSSDYDNLSYFIKSVLILSHGNAAVERGFLVNKQCLVENQQARSLVAQRTIYDALVLSEFLAEEKRNKQEADEIKDSRKRNAQALKELEVKKKRIMDDALMDSSLINAEINALKKT